MDSGLYSSRHDAVQMALALWDACHGDPYEYSLRTASHVKRLQGFGADADIEFAFRMNTCGVVPCLKEGTLHCIETPQ
jgi:phosphosulfolactate phosphohydrolase-like enzyme